MTITIINCVFKGIFTNTFGFIPKKVLNCNHNATTICIGISKVRVFPWGMVCVREEERDNWGWKGKKWKRQRRNRECKRVYNIIPLVAIVATVKTDRCCYSFRRVVVVVVTAPSFSSIMVVWFTLIAAAESQANYIRIYSTHKHTHTRWFRCAVVFV